MDCFSLLACLPSLGPIATRVSDKSKQLRERKSVHTSGSRLLRNTSPPGKASSAKNSSDERESQIPDSSSDIEKQEEALRSGTHEATCCTLEPE